MLFSATLYAQSDENILAPYQKNGLTFTNVKDDPIQEVGAKLITNIYGRLGIPVAILDLPGIRALNSASEGKADGEVMRIMRIQELYPTLVRLSPHLDIVSGSVFVKQGRNIDINGWPSISEYKVGVTRGVQYSADGVKSFKHKQSLNADEGLLMFLYGDRVDLVVTARYNGLYLLKKMNLENQIQVLSPPVASFRLYHYLHIKHRALVPIVEDLLLTLAASGELYQLRDRYKKEALEKVSVR